jgi:L-rhamnose mutarotase
VDKVMQRYKFQIHAECPRCSEFKDTIHVIRCKSPLAITQWDSLIATLDAWLLQAGTMPNQRHAIVSRLKAWKTHAPQSDPQYTWPDVNDLVKNQDIVGWRSFLEGCILQQDWAAKQQAYYDWLQRKNTGKQWTTTLIKKTMGSHLGYVAAKE